MKVRGSAVALLWCAGAAGSAWASSPRPSVEARLAAVVPKGWSAQRTGLPKGVLVVFQGPRLPDGQAVVSVAELSPPLAEIAGDPEALRSALGGAIEAVGPGPFGGVAVDRRDGPRRVRQWVVRSRVSYLVTIAAPEPLFEDTVRKVQKAIAELVSQDEASLPIKPTKAELHLDSKGLDSGPRKAPDNPQPGPVLAGKGSAE